MALTKSKVSSKTLRANLSQMIDVSWRMEVGKAPIGLPQSHLEGRGAARRCMQAGARAMMTSLNRVANLRAAPASNGYRKMNPVHPLYLCAR